MKQYQIDKEQFISDLQGLLRIKSVRFDCGPETEKAPLGQGIYDAIEYMLELGRRFGFRTKNVDGYCGWIEMGEGDRMVGIIAHVDTVPVESEGWIAPPFDGTVIDGRIYGRGTSDDNIRKTGTIQSGSFDVGASMPLFDGFRINREIKGGKLDLAAAMQDLERAREDLSINVMTLYLQVLYNKELTQIAERQLDLSTQQAVRSRELVAAGKQPESARYESEALQANDELNLTQAHNDLRLALLNLSQALNRESAAGFDIVAPQLDSVALASLHVLGTADDVYAYATENRPHIKAERLRLESAENAVRIAKSALYPSLSLRGGYGTGIYSTQEAAFGTQFRKNSSEFVGVSMSVPIFNRRATHNSILSARIAMRKQQLAVTDAEQSLRKEIEQAWYNADAAYGKYRSADAALASARVAFAYEQQKADAGRSTVFDFNDAKTRMEKAESELVQAKYEFVFRSKILDFYRGRPLEL